MPISAYEFARHHIPLNIAMNYKLTCKQQNPLTIRSGMTLLGVEVIPQDGAYPVVHTHPIKILGFCDQGLFTEKVKRPRKKVRFYEEHPIEHELRVELYTRLSKYRRENRTLGWSHYEPPTMVAQSLLITEKSYFLLQAHDSLEDSLEWKNNGVEITWFVLEKTPEPEMEEITTPHSNPPHEITSEIETQDYFAHGMISFKNLKVGAQLRPHDLKKGYCVALSGTVRTMYENRKKPPQLHTGTKVQLGMVIGFAKAASVSPYLQPKSFQELTKRMSLKKKVQYYDDTEQGLKYKEIAGLRWQQERRNLLGKVDLTTELYAGAWKVYPTWNDIPAELLECKGDISDYAPKIVLLMEDLYSTEITNPIEVHVPSLQALDINQPLDIYAVFNEVRGKVCAGCGSNAEQVDFDSAEDTYCWDCTKKNAALDYAPKALHPLLEYIYECEPIQTQELDETGLYIKVAFGGGMIRDYHRTLDETFVRQKREWIDELEGDFTFACDHKGQAREYFSKEYGATLRLIYDDVDGIEAQLWLEPSKKGGAQ